MRPGDRITLTIEKPAAGGRMIARLDGAIVLVSGAIPGETVEAVVERQQRGTLWAKTRVVLEPSPDRLDEVSDIACGGNVLAHVAYPRQLELKCDIVRDAFARIGKIELLDVLPIEPSPVEGYRMRARLHAQGGRIGFFREGTHSLCDPGPTRQLLPATLDVIAQLEAVLRSIPEADDAEIELAENIPATERAVHLSLPRGLSREQLDPAWPTDRLNGISWATSAAARVTNLIGTTRVTDAIEVTSGSDTLTVKLERHAHSFFQGNRYLLGRLMSGVAALVPAGAVLDLYAGVGPFAMTLAARGDTLVTAVEGDPRAAADLENNVARAGSGVTVRHRAVEAALAEDLPSGIETVIVDPPRTGLSKESTAGVLTIRPTRIVYVSCDVATAARDARAFGDGGYRLTIMRAFDMFPNTAHVETLMLFER